MAEIDELNLPAGCRLAADADCQWSIDCNGHRAKEVLRKAG
jgi:hypothetical protein